MIRTLTFAYQDVRNASFSENFAYIQYYIENDRKAWFQYVIVFIFLYFLLQLTVITQTGKTLVPARSHVVVGSSSSGARAQIHDLNMEGGLVQTKLNSEMQNATMKDVQVLYGLPNFEKF